MELQALLAWAKASPPESKTTVTVTGRIRAGDVRPCPGGDFGKEEHGAVYGHGVMVVPIREITLRIQEEFMVMNGEINPPGTLRCSQFEILGGHVTDSGRVMLPLEVQESLPPHLTEINWGVHAAEFVAESLQS